MGTVNEDADILLRSLREGGPGIILETLSGGMRSFKVTKVLFRGKGGLKIQIGRKEFEIGEKEAKAELKTRVIRERRFAKEKKEKP